MDQFINVQAADTNAPPNIANAPDDVASAPDDVGTIEEKYKNPIVFLREKDIFGERKPDQKEWLQHTEMYRAIGTKINATHITGLQRVRGLWRIYLDNIQDKVTLMAEGVPLRGKTINVLNTNPDRFDGEQTVRIRIKNIPLSVDDGLIKRTITLKEIEVISMYRERLRIDNKLTNCETGDRIVIVKSTSLKEPLPTSMSFGHFTGRVIHQGQQKNVKFTQRKCSKCLQEGHTFNSCTNDWVCTLCNKSGHKRLECTAAASDGEKTDVSESESSNVESSDDESDSMPKQNVKATKGSRNRSRSTKTRTPRRSRSNTSSVKTGVTQQSMDKYVTPNKGKTSKKLERSPVTPTEELHDKQVEEKSKKKQKNK